jgi:hypothetical protein
LSSIIHKEVHLCSRGIEATFIIILNFHMGLFLGFLFHSTGYYLAIVSNCLS